MPIRILDCTLRDGGYINNWRFNNNFTSEYNRLIEKNDIDYVEFGFVNKTKNYKGLIVGNERNLDKSLINNYNLSNDKKVVMADYADINMELLKQKLNIELIRIAFHKKDLNSAIKCCIEVKKLGYKVSVNAMAITNYSDDELIMLFKYVNDNRLDILYLADSYGSLNQKKINKYLHMFDSKLYPECSIGFHLHNNMNNAYSNYEFIVNNVSDIDREIIVDTTIFGMGRGAGNLQTELVLVNKYNNNIENIVEILSFIQVYIKPIYNHLENKWGYELDYLLSGYLNMHPNYIGKMRDLNISMVNRFFLIEKMIEKKIKYNYFDIKIVNSLVEEFKYILL